MGETTNISWSDATMNWWEGCTKVSTGAKGACENCYAEHLVQNRFGRAQWGNHPRRQTSAANRRKPFGWDKKAAASGKPFFVFVNSLSDIFDNQVPIEWLCEAFDTIEATRNLTYLLLTKRPQNIVKRWLEVIRHRRAAKGVAGETPSDGQLLAHYRFPANAALLCTVVTQVEADRDLQWLLAAKAALQPAFAGVSMEPLMEEVNLRNLAIGHDTLRLDALTGCYSASRQIVGAFHSENIHRALADIPKLPERLPPLDWVITGGETSQGSHQARPSDVRWFRSLRDQCAAAGLAYHHKQNGEWLCGDQVPEEDIIPSGIRHGFVEGDDDNTSAWLVGKKFSGRALDGVIHDARPELV